MIMQAASLLSNNPTATIEELESGMNDNLCRCGTYPRVRNALIQLRRGKVHEH
jgi:isoquinoline 1-oxidoreductase alpha subunit